MPAKDESQTLTGRPSASDGKPAETGDDACLDELIGEIRQTYGESVLAILVYGSWLRGKRDTMLDFYVLVDNYKCLGSTWQALMCRLLPPNVYHIHQASPGQGEDPPECRAKYALLTLKRFQQAMRRDFHSYFWARFAQPCEVLYARDADCRAALDDTFSAASEQFLHRTIPAMGDSFTSQALWTRGLALTYACELRTEGKDRGESIYTFAAEHYAGLTRRFAGQHGSPLRAEQDGLYTNLSTPAQRRLSGFGWWLRRIQGKVLSVLRLTKASFTFNDALDYLLWKIRRHSGMYIEPTPRQRRHPLVFAWPLLWKLYRKGAFR
jgi:hypothetical protein